MRLLMLAPYLSTGLALALFLLGACAPPAVPPPPIPGAGVPLTGPSGETLRLQGELARTPEEMARGLSKREHLPEGAGMLFVFPGETRIPFWMKDTYVALSIAFIAGDGTIVDLQDMETLSEELHYPRAPYRYALEVNQGLFARHGIRVGDRVGLPPLPR